jgi:hypothetical protein
VLQLFIAGDADHVRQRVNRLVFEGDCSGLRNFSEVIHSAIREAVTTAANQFSAELVYTGGDDILFQAPVETFSQEHLSDLMRGFRRATGCTISFGVGRSLEEAFLNLAKAKAFGPGVCITYD